jgi:hypothetical protein
VDPDPIVTRVVSDVETFLNARVKQLEGQLREDRRKKHDLQNEKLVLSVQLGECRVELAQIKAQLAECREREQRERPDE